MAARCARSPRFPSGIGERRASSSTCVIRPTATWRATSRSTQRRGRRDVPPRRERAIRSRLRHAGAAQSAPGPRVDHRLRPNRSVLAPQGLRRHRPRQDRWRSTRSRPSASGPAPRSRRCRTARSRAAQLALHGILAALYERETSGRGQRVETTLVQAIAAHDPWNWLIPIVARRYPDAFTATAPVDTDREVPNSALVVPLDGRALGRRSVAAVLADLRPALARVPPRARVRVDAHRSGMEGRRRVRRHRPRARSSGYGDRSDPFEDRRRVERGVRRGSQRVRGGVPHRNRTAPPPADRPQRARDRDRRPGVRDRAPARTARRDAHHARIGGPRRAGARRPRHGTAHAAVEPAASRQQSTTRAPHRRWPASRSSSSARTTRLRSARRSSPSWARA